LSEFLKKAGFEVLASDSGYNAMRLLQTRSHNTGALGLDAVVCDWKMPG